VVRKLKKEVKEEYMQGKIELSLSEVENESDADDDY
jgi:hypothetical protein